MTPVSYSPPIFLNVPPQSCSGALSSSLPTSYTWIFHRVSSSLLIFSPEMNLFHSTALTPKPESDFSSEMQNHIGYWNCSKAQFKKNPHLWNRLTLPTGYTLPFFQTSIGCCPHLLADSHHIRPQLIAVYVLVLLLLVDCKPLDGQNFAFFITAFSLELKAVPFPW